MNFMPKTIIARCMNHNSNSILTVTFNYAENVTENKVKRILIQ